MDVFMRKELCDEENDYIQERLQRVKDWMHSHDIQCRDNELPRVALMGSGGGQRAQIAFMGVLRQLAEDGLLDSILYLAGVSGSTWAMSSLYDDAHWPDKVDSLVELALRSMSDHMSSSHSDSIEWLINRYNEGDLSLADLWGVFVCDEIKGVKLETRTLKDEAQRDNKGATPYPIYSAVERALLDEERGEDLWFEVSPHEAGFTEHGAFVKTSLLKQPFESGNVKLSDRKPMDMVQLQGICGSAFGDTKKNEEFFKDKSRRTMESMWDMLKAWLTTAFSGTFASIEDPGSSDKVEDDNVDGRRPFHATLLNLIEHVEDMEKSYDLLQKLKSELAGFCDSSIYSETLTVVDPIRWGEMRDEHKRKHIATIFHELDQSLNPSMKLKLKATYSLSWNWWDGAKLLLNFYLLRLRWEFGTVANFLYKLTDDQIPKDMCKEHIMHVIDAGLYLNSPYPPLLGKKRDIDLIISFDFSEGDDPFQTVREAHRYSKVCKVPFPKIILDEDNDCPKSLHIFEEKGKPTVIHIPLFNKDNCKDPAGVKKEWDEYKTFQKPYRDMKKIKHLADLAAMNARINKEAILKEIRKAAQRRN